jgi:hypothetical protein
MLYTTINGKTDSVWLKKEQLKPLLQTFFTPEIDTANLQNYFTETKFKDQSINAITITYDPSGQLPDSIQLRNWTIYIDPETENVRSIYIVKQFKEKDQLITQQLMWNTDKSAKITTIRNQADGNTVLLKEEKFIFSDNL